MGAVEVARPPTGHRPATQDDRLRVLRDDAYVHGVRELLTGLSPKLLVGGEWVDPRSGHTATSIDPSTGREFADHAIAGDEDVDDAVAAAAAAQPAWAGLSVAERADHVAHLAQLIDANGALLAAVDAIDAGLPVARMLNDVDGVLRAARAWPGMATALRGEVLQDGPGLHYTRYEPYGVVARIVAYNHPLLFAVKGTLAPLLAGNTVVLKPADQTPMSARVLGELFQEALPPGVMNVLTGGAECGAALVSHPEIRRIAFTGSVPTGRLIQETASRDRVRTVSLELGGKNPMIVFPDVEVERVARDVVVGMNLRANQGQSCGSTSRLFVHQDVHDRFESALTKELGALSLGPAIDPDVDMGPMVSAPIAEKVRGYIGAGTEDGARLVAGGLDDPRLPDEGYFVAPTLFADVPPDARIATEEIFGPVISMFSWDDRDEAIQAANAVEYGLTASVWTNDVTMALDTAHRLEAGYVWVNESARHHFGMPFGGWKDSGVGREESMEELQGFLQQKSVHVKLS